MEGSAGAGYCIYRGAKHVIDQGSVPLGQSAEVYDAEVVGAMEGLAAAIRNPMAYYATNITVCLDNQEAASRLLLGPPTPSSSTRIAKFRDLARSWPSRNRARYTEPGRVSVRWCPAHSGIPGNEKADALAKAACTITAPNLAPSIARARRIVNLRYEASASEYWSRNAPDRYRALRIGPSSRITPELASMDRRSLGLLLAARSGHGDFAAYHRRFAHNSAPLTCSCGHDKSPEHFMTCQHGLLQARLRGANRPRPPDARWILSSPEGAILFRDWLKSTLFFRRVSKVPLMGEALFAPTFVGQP